MRGVARIGQSVQVRACVSRNRAGEVRETTTADECKFVVENKCIVGAMEWERETIVCIQLFD